MRPTPSTSPTALASAGYEIATKAEDASVLVLNTCTVRDNAERRAYGRMGHFKTLKDRDPDLRLVVMGCLAEQDRDRMQTLAPHVDAVFGTKELVEFGDRLDAWKSSFDSVAEGRDARENNADEGASAEELYRAMGGTADAVIDAFSHLRAFVTVQRGCSYYCTFCIVPHVRGRFDHRPMHEIVAEAQQHLANGAREIMLVGQTVNAWHDAGERVEDFGDLCKAVAALPGLERLTFISPHPKDFTEKIVADLATVPQLNPRMHLPLQSGSDPMLRRMNRKYTRAQFEEKLALVASLFAAVGDYDRYHRRFPGRERRGFRGDDGSRRDRRFRQRLHVYLFDPARHAGGALGASAARGVLACAIRG